MTKDFSYHVSYFLSEYLPKQLGSRGNTILSYRDTFSLLLRYIADKKGVAITKLKVSYLTADIVAGFLQWLEAERGCGVNTRNQRLAAIQSFYKYLQREGDPAELALYQKVLTIPSKKAPKDSISYLTTDNVRLLLEQPNVCTKPGRRDLVLLSALYDTGARVQEIVDLTAADVRFTEPATLRLHGKGGKERIVPLMNATKDNLRLYMEENRLNIAGCGASSLFFNSSGKKLTRNGIAYIISKYAKMAQETETPEFPNKISPHSMRHSKAMHLLQAGVNLVYIRDLLGHVNIQTTEVYARADTKMKRAALEAASPPLAKNLEPWKQDADLLTWLKALK